MSRLDDIRTNLARVESRIHAACERAGRTRGDVQLVAVTKTFPAIDVDAAIAAGVTDVGENKVQETRDKKPLVKRAAKWHLLGHLQSNKAKDAVRLFDVVQSVDSIALAEKLARAAEAAGRSLDVFLEVNIGREPQKSGFDSADVSDASRKIAAFRSLRVCGLMAIPPVSAAEEARKWFRALRTLRDGLGLQQLSMGMTDDFEMAIEEGATVVRVGRAIFGSRG